MSEDTKCTMIIMLWHERTGVIVSQ